MAGTLTDTNHIDHIIEQVLARYDQTDGEGGEDIYVWSNGLVTGPPKGSEEDDTRLLLVVTPGSERPTREELRENLADGLDVVDIPAEETPQPAAALSEEEQSAENVQVATNPHFKNWDAGPPVR